MRTEAQLGADMMAEAMANKHMRKKDYIDQYTPRGPGETGKYILTKLTDHPQTIAQIMEGGGFSYDTVRKAMLRLEQTEDAKCAGQVKAKRNMQKLWVRA